MSDFSTICIHEDFPLIPQQARRFWYQSKDLPEYEAGAACIDGDIRADGIFVRHDGQWNPSLNGWTRLRAQFGSNEFSLRFQNGFAVEVIIGRRLPAGANLADLLPHQWRDIGS